jgi:hypothetical protein
LSLWLQRAAVSHFSPTITELAITALCGIDASADAAPVAALSHLEDFGELPTGYCLRADPVHLRADTTGLVLFDTTAFELDEAECRALSGTLAAHLAQDGWDLRFQHPQRWYLSGGPSQDLITAPLPAVRGTAVAPVPFTGADAPAWISRLNELQMLMHDHPVNRTRVAARRIAVNSLWLWGGGEPRRQAAARCSHVCADNALARGSARFCGAPVTSMSDGAEALVRSMAADEQRLVVLEDCRDAAAYQDIADWQAALHRLERNWFAVLIRSLRTGRLDNLDLYPLNGYCYRLTRPRSLSFWKGRGDYLGHSGFRRPGANRV